MHDCTSSMKDFREVASRTSISIIAMVWRIQSSAKSQHGGDIILSIHRQIRDEYSANMLHPSDLKNALARAINKILEPVRLLEKVKSVTLKRNS